MPLFTRKSPKQGPTTDGGSQFGSRSSMNSGSSQGSHISNNNNNNSIPEKSKPPLVFHCQLAHGSPTGLIHDFSSVRELYQKIAECFDISEKDILFCTLNSHKVDMTRLLGGQIGLDDFIFAHRKGRPKEIEIVKSQDALGLTITDNGAGYAFIKRIKEDSIIDRIEHICVGDHIEKLNGQNMVGKRHYEVARMLKDIATGETFTLRLVEPVRSGFQGIGPRSQSRASGSGSAGGRNYGSGKETLRFKANGNAQIEPQFDEATVAGIEAINNLLESFMGINDTELASQIWDLGDQKSNSMDFAEAIDNSDLESFGFTDDFIIELWGAITDARRKSTTSPK
ncbi:PDZ domain-containing protein GIPC3 [Drosophila rhopaloa]|uniref:PDZ domain-containing protein GIPC3 n=1 Tax=Drosophila rhopaloa TaxID=1041015 RepID=A0A6P4DXI9_DRORH|nr:PDZ domain-containing protein GIPC3 [Drosophila rhopaloa]XP_016970222.1 PDZ domain-containing protein GIPC3 [Drosophila rhopaloa]XP_016970223.1 PDZ domain-containing protein GIPC3 [Drosophila rhopaloa]XP_016970224.1 PDZ domain-containing protein GIPC3 [Drosophila rhopaloa]XP_016970225.1 PDZ domain-containing protein GIPC3 [Drosophila rhopaloa]XP_016970226.1 PDZ domain-containing protein GIPC3 [Drosophila rhopaloa]